MFRGERLDFTRPALRAASKAAFGVLASSANGNHRESRESFALLQAAQIASAWSLAHGLALLLIDGRLQPFIGKLPAGTGETELLAAIFRGGKEKG